MDSQTEDLFQAGCVTISGLKDEFGIGRSHAYELMNAGLLPFTTAGECRRRLVPRQAVRLLLARHLVPVASTDLGK